MDLAGTFERLVDDVYAAATNLLSRDHGPAHWKRVAEVCWHLCEGTVGADPEVVLAFAVFHDACRVNNDWDPQHGERAAELVTRFAAAGRLELGSAQSVMLCRACARHHHSDVSSDPTIGACFDADRLTLWWVGIEPDPSLLSTARGQTRLLELGRDLEHVAPLDWPALLAAYVSRRLPSGRPRPPAARDTDRVAAARDD